MSLQEKDQATTHQPLLSSLVIRPTDSSGGGGGGGGGGTGSDYEPGEVRRDPLRYSRSDRYDGQGYRMRAGSASPVRRRDPHPHHRFSPGFEPSHGASRGRGRDPGRYHRDYSPPYGRGKNDGRFAGRGYDRSARGPGSFKTEGLPRNNPNVRPREGDWICSDPSCKNLNFARRDHCNNCNKPRYASSGSSPRRGYPAPPFPPRQRPPPNPLDRPIINGGYRSPPRGWLRDAPRDPRAGGGPPPPRQDYPEEDRYRYDNNRAMVPDWAHRDRGRDNYFNERRGYGRRMLSPPPLGPPPPRGWAPNVRDRSRSPVRGGPPQPKEYERDVYANRRRNGRRGGGAVGRDAF